MPPEHGPRFRNAHFETLSGKVRPSGRPLVRHFQEVEPSAEAQFAALKKDRFFRFSRWTTSESAASRPASLFCNPYIHVPKAEVLTERVTKTLKTHEAELKGTTGPFDVFTLRRRETAPTNNGGGVALGNAAGVVGAAAVVSFGLLVFLVINASSLTAACLRATRRREAGQGEGEDAKSVAHKNRRRCGLRSLWSALSVT